jgi:hypothetical protein
MGQWEEDGDRYFQYLAEHTGFLPELSSMSRSDRMGREEWLAEIPTGWWLTAQSLKMLISNMDDNHLANTIAMVGRWGMTHTDKYKELVAEQEKRNAPIQSIR